MNIKFTLGIMLLSILLVNLWSSTILEGIYNPAPTPPSTNADVKRTLTDHLVCTICEGGFVLPGFPRTVLPTKAFDKTCDKK